MLKLLNIFRTQNEKKLEFVANIINASAPKVDFYLLIILATALVALGITANNIVLVIAGMIIAPLLSSILAISLGLAVGSWRLIWRSFKIFLISVSIAFLASILIGWIFPLGDASQQLLATMEVSYLSFTIALIAGLTAAFTWRRPNTRDALPGIAIAVTLVPPLAALGLVFASEKWQSFVNISEFFTMNVAGILLAGLLVFFLPNLSITLKAKKLADQEIKEEQSSGNK